MAASKPIDFNVGVFVAIAGPTGCGKTYICKKLRKRLGNSSCLVLSLDNYYKDWSHLPKIERKKLNFDHRNAYDFQLLETHLKCLRNKQTVDSPRYDFKESKRLQKTMRLEPKPVIIVEGLMPFIEKRLRRLFDLTIYINASETACLMRRIRRDVKSRAESIESTCKRYLAYVLPMQKKFVEPQKKLAHIVVDGALDQTKNTAHLCKIIGRRLPRLNGAF